MAQIQELFIDNFKDNKKNEARERGLFCEKLVLDFYINKNYSLCNHRLMTPFGEVDLFLKDFEGNYLVVEVKSLSNKHFQFYRLSKGQKQRLLKSVEFLSQKFNAQVQFHLAFVNRENLIEIIDDFY